MNAYPIFSIGPHLCSFCQSEITGKFRTQCGLNGHPIPTGIASCACRLLTTCWHYLQLDSHTMIYLLKCTIDITVLQVPLCPVCESKGVIGDKFCKYCGVTMIQPCSFPCSTPIAHQYHDNTSSGSPSSSPSMSCHLMIFLECLLCKLV